MAFNGQPFSGLLSFVIRLYLSMIKSLLNFIVIIKMIKLILTMNILILIAEDCANDQLTLKEYMDPFTGSQYK